MRKGDPERGALLLIVTSRGQHFACLERVLDLDGAYLGRRLGPANRRVPPKLPISSQNVHGSTRICGRSNWISRSPNGSSLKRPLRVDRRRACGETRAQQQERGAFLHGKNRWGCHARRGTADGSKRKYSQVIIAPIFGGSPQDYGFQCWLRFVQRCCFVLRSSRRSIAPARAGLRASPCCRSTARACRRSPVPDLLDPQGEPQLAGLPQTCRRPATLDVPRRDSPPGAADGDLADDGRAASQRRRREPRARMPRHRHLFRIEERAARRPARRRQGHRQPRRTAAAASRRPIAACCSSAANSPSSTAIRCRRCRIRTGSGRRPSPSPRSSTRICRNRSVGDALFFHARYVSPGWRLKRVAAIGNHVFYR